jgi:hypothetical protein
VRLDYRGHWFQHPQASAPDPHLQQILGTRMAQPKSGNGPSSVV